MKIRSKAKKKNTPERGKYSLSLLQLQPFCKRMTFQSILFELNTIVERDRDRYKFGYPQQILSVLGTYACIYSVTLNVFTTLALHRFVQCDDYLNERKNTTRATLEFHMLHRYCTIYTLALLTACIDIRISMHICCFVQHWFDRYTSTAFAAIHVLFIFIFFFFLIARFHFAGENLERFINALSRFLDKILHSKYNTFEGSLVGCWLPSDHIPYSHPLSYGEICYFGTRVCHSSHLSYVSFRFVAHIFQKKKMNVNSKSIAKRIFFFLHSSRRFECILPLSVFASDPYNEISVSEPLSVHSLLLTPVTCIHNSTCMDCIGITQYRLSVWFGQNGRITISCHLVRQYFILTLIALTQRQHFYDFVANILKWISIIDGLLLRKKKRSEIRIRCPLA